MSHNLWPLDLPNCVNGTLLDFYCTRNLSDQTIPFIGIFFGKVAIKSCDCIFLKMKNKILWFVRDRLFQKHLIQNSDSVGGGGLHFEVSHVKVLNELWALSSQNFNPTPLPYDEYCSQVLAEYNLWYSNFDILSSYYVIFRAPT